MQILENGSMKNFALWSICLIIDPTSMPKGSDLYWLIYGPPLALARRGKGSGAASRGSMVCSATNESTLVYYIFSFYNLTNFSLHSPYILNYLLTWVGKALSRDYFSVFRASVFLQMKAQKIELCLSFESDLTQGQGDAVLRITVEGKRSSMQCSSLDCVCAPLESGFWGLDHFCWIPPILTIFNIRKKGRPKLQATFGYENDPLEENVGNKSHWQWTELHFWIE